MKFKKGTREYELVKEAAEKGSKVDISVPIYAKGVDVDSKTLEAVFSDQKEDRHGDTVMQEGWDLKSFKKNPVILNSHNYNDAAEVVGRAISIKIENKKLVGKIQFAVDENPKAKVIFDLYAGGFLSAFSVGLIPKKFKDDDYFVIEEAELLEISAVSVPANARALAKKKGINVDVLKSNDDNEEEAGDEDADEVPEDTEVPDADEETTPGNDDGGEGGQDEEDEEAEPNAGGDGGDSDDTDDEEEDEDEREDTKCAKCAKVIGSLSKRLIEKVGAENITCKSCEDEDEGDDTMIEHTGKANKKKKTYGEKVVSAINKYQQRRTNKIKKVARLVDSLLDEPTDSATMTPRVKEKVRKRNVNKAIRTLFEIK